MKTHKERFMPAFEMSPATDSTLAEFARQLQDIEAVASRLRGQLAEYALATGHGGLKRQAEALRTWMDINAEGLSVAARVAELGPAWAEEVRTRLEAADEGLKRADEAPESLAEVWNEINSVLDSMEALYHPKGLMSGLEKAAEPANVAMR